MFKNYVLYVNGVVRFENILNLTTRPNEASISLRRPSIRRDFKLLSRESN